VGGEKKTSRARDCSDNLLKKKKSPTGGRQKPTRHFLTGKKKGDQKPVDSSKKKGKAGKERAQGKKVRKHGEPVGGENAKGRCKKKKGKKVHSDNVQGGTGGKGGVKKMGQAGKEKHCLFLWGVNIN